MRNITAVDISNREIIDIISRQKQSISLLTNIENTYPVKRLIDNIKELSSKYEKNLVYQITYDNLDEWYDIIKLPNFMAIMGKHLNISQYIHLLEHNYSRIMNCIETRIDDSTYLKIKKALSTRNNFYDKILINNCPIYGAIHMNIDKFSKCFMPLEYTKNHIYTELNKCYLHPITCYEDLFNEIYEIIKSQERKEIVELTINGNMKLIFKYYNSKDLESKPRRPYFINSVPNRSKIDSMICDLEHFFTVNQHAKVYIDFNYSSPNDSFSVYSFY